MNRNVLKILLMIFMTMDHCAYAFLPISSWQFQIMRFFGRMVAPVMCYLLAEGFRKTADFRKYLARMLGFALLAHLPYLFLGHRNLMLHPSGILSTVEFSMLFTLAVCLLMMKGFETVEKTDYSSTLKLAMNGLIEIIAVLATARSDWAGYAPLYVTACYFNHDDQKKCFLSMAFVSLLVYVDGYQGLLPRYGNNTFRYLLFETGMFASLILLKLYNHQRGRLNLKYAFYLYYPLHLAVIDLIVYYNIAR